MQEHLEDIDISRRGYIAGEHLRDFIYRKLDNLPIEQLAGPIKRSPRDFVQTMQWPSIAALPEIGARFQQHSRRVLSGPDRPQYHSIFEALGLPR